MGPKTPQTVVTTVATTATVTTTESTATDVFELDEATIADLQLRMTNGKDTARSLAQKYLKRIDEIDRNGPTLKSVIELNPDALSIAEALDEERKNRGSRGALHGIPVLIKGNIATADRMTTTAGSFALGVWTINSTPSLFAAPFIIQASCPPPIIPSFIDILTTHEFLHQFENLHHWLFDIAL